MVEEKPLILIASDGADWIDALEDKLAGAGLASIKVDSLSKAAQVARSERPGLILLDVPDNGDDEGLRTCEELKMHRLTNLIPVVLLTPRDTHQDLVKGIRVGADRYFTKPFKVGQLLTSISALLAHKGENSGALRGEVEFDMRSDERYLEELNHMFTRLFRYTPFSDEEINIIRTALTEMGLNAIEWGNHNDQKLLVKLRYRIDDEKLVISIRDEGEGFDTGNVPHAARPGDLVSHLKVRHQLGMREGGFGILISRSLMDKLEYSEKGNEVTLIKYFPKRKDQDKG